MRHQVRNGLQQLILSGERPPGSKLRQQELAQRFGVAQGVVREALLELQAFGLVETIDNRGIYVSKLDKQTLLESFEVREVQEGLAARLCCDRVTRADLRTLVDLANNIFALGQEGRMDDMGLMDRTFHERLTQLSGNGMLVRLAENHRVLGKIVHAKRDAQIVRDEHLGVLRAIEEGRPDDAERLMRQHVAAARLAVEKGIENGGFTPHWVV